MAIRKIGIVGRTYRHVQRYRQILAILFRYGFGDLLDRLQLEQYIEIGLKLISRRREAQIESLTRVERVRRAFEELGPTFVKMGQVLSTRPDLLPAEFVEELSKLQDAVPPFDFEQVRETVEHELGRPLDEIFERFDPVPLASASLGQVHAARLPDGEEVVVKVQRPGIRQTIDVDLEILLHLATLGERHLEGWETYRPSRIVEEFARSVQRELDYQYEAAHMERFGWQFLREPTIHVPEVHRDLCSRRVLTMERVDGVKPSDFAALAREGMDRGVVARRGAELVMKQIFVHGFFHADPHPGNLRVLPGNVVCFLDFGMMGRLDRTSRENFVDLVQAVAAHNEARTVDALLRITDWDTEPERDELERDTADFIDRHLCRSLGELQLGSLLNHLIEALARHDLRLPSDMFMMLKAFVTLEGLARSLDPEFDVAGAAVPFVRRVQLARMHPSRVAGDAMDYGSELVRLLREVPGELRQLLRLTRRGRLKIEFEHRRLEPLIHAHDQVSNRLSFAIVLASLVIGSALIVLSGVPPKWNEIPVIGLIGFIVAGLMGFWLLLSILKHGKM